MKYEHFEMSNWQDMCVMFKHPLSKRTATDVVKLPGLKRPLRVFQAFAVFLMLSISHGPAAGCILGDEMGLGKVSHSACPPPPLPPGGTHRKEGRRIEQPKKQAKYGSLLTDLHS